MQGKTDLSTFRNDWYKPGNPIKRALWYLCNVAFIKSYWLPLGGFKVFLLRLFGAKIGQGLVIKPGVNIKYPWRLEIGDFVWLGEGVWIDNLDQVRIGDHCCLSQGAMLLCGNHDYKKIAFDLIVKPIVLEEGAWIGAQAIVCPGVVAQSHAILSVKSVATSVLEPYTIYQGNPAVAVRKREIPA